MAERITKINRLEKSKEQLKLESLNEVTDAIVENKDSILKAIRIIKNLDDAKPVSYTHLTLPTILRV